MKPGVRTSEFWLSLLVFTVFTALVVLGRLDGDTYAAAVASLGSVYSLARTSVKRAKDDDIIPPPPPPPPPPPRVEGE